MVDYKSILIKNITSNCRTTLFIYSKYDPVCFLSTLSKILLPGESYLHRSEDGFKFKIKTKSNKSSKTVVDVRKYIKDLHFTICNEEEVREIDLEDNALDKTLCIRKLNVLKEASLDQGLNLYEILKLNFGEIRKLKKKEEQDKEIKKAFHREIRRWHTDIAGELGDNDMAHEVLVAYDILRNHEKRAEYHNKADYSKGWLSKSRWKSIFFTEYATPEQEQRYKRRLLMMLASAVFVIAGSTLTFCTAGAAAPVVGICGALGAGCLGGGVQSFLRTINRKSIEEGCDVKDYLKSFGLGFVAGAVAGGAGVGILDGIVGIGSAAITVSSTTVEQFIAVSASSAAVGGIAFSLAADADKKIVDGIDVTWKQFVYHALVGAIIGGITGSAVGAVSGAAAGWTVEVSSTNTEVVLVSGGRRFGLSLAKSVAKGVINKISVSFLEDLAGYAEEIADDERENRPAGEHFKGSVMKCAAKITGSLALSLVLTTATHVKNEIKILIEESKDESNDESNDSDETKFKKKQDQRQKDRFDLYKKQKLTHSESNVKATYTPLEKQGEQESFGQTTHPVIDIEHIEVTRARFIYISKGLWMSKMIIEYTENHGEQKKQTTNSGSAIEIPLDARNVRVSFEVMRFIKTWCKVKKWDRFEKKWYGEPHIFKYEKSPEERRYTIDGSLYFEGVINITNERFDDVKDL